MSYVYNGRIYSEQAVYRKIRWPIRLKLSDAELEQLGVFKLAESTPPVGDVVDALPTASLVNGVYIRDYSVRSYTAEELAEYKRIAIISVSNHYQNKMDELTELYPQFEQSTWKWQYEEALALQLDSQAPSPIIDRVVQWSDGFTKIQYVTYILNNMPTYLNVAGKYVGLLLDAKIAIKNATTRKDIDDIVSAVVTA